MNKKEQFQSIVKEITVEGITRMSFCDFMEVCDNLEIPVLEIKLYTNPFAGVYDRMTETKYKSLGEYYRMNDIFKYAVRNYNYELDVLCEFRDIEIVDCKFSESIYCFSRSSVRYDFELNDDYLEIIYHHDVDD